MNIEVLSIEDHKRVCFPEVNDVSPVVDKIVKGRKGRNIFEALFLKKYLDGYYGYTFQGNQNPGGRGNNTKVKSFGRLEIKLQGKNISIPQSIKKRLLELSKDPNTHYLDCRRFAGELCDLGNTVQKETLQLKKDRNFIPGKIYGFVKGFEQKDFLKNSANGGEYHFLVYLGNGLFISKPGRNAEIIITELEETRNGFEIDYDTLVEDIR